MDPQAWLDLFALNVHSIFYGCRAAIAVLRRGGGGASVDTASISGLFADYGLGPFDATQGAVVNYTRSLAIDHACDGIRVDAVGPGPIETPLLAPALTIPGVPDAYARRLPLGRIGRPGRWPRPSPSSPRTTHPT